MFLKPVDDDTNEKLRQTDTNSSSNDDNDDGDDNGDDNGDDDGDNVTPRKRYIVT